jgi:transposase
MKNKYRKGAHVSERKFREILKLFCEDLTATQIAEASNISRVTINNYLKLLRTQIAAYSAESMQPKYEDAWVSYKSLTEISNTALTANFTGKLLVGICKKDGNIITERLQNPEFNEVIEWAKGRATDLVTERLNNMAGHYCALIDFNSNSLYKIREKQSWSDSYCQSDEVEEFWKLLKTRIAKFRGLSGHTLWLHIKETEFRYNNRQVNLFELLNFILLKQPVPYSNAV